MDYDIVEIKSASDLPGGNVIRDSRIDICTKLTISREITFENCEMNIIGSKGGALLVKNTRVMFCDCMLHFEKNGITLTDADLELDSCECMDWDFATDTASIPSEGGQILHISAKGNKRDITFTGTKFLGMCGPVLFSMGTNVHIEDCLISEHQGMFAFVRSGEYVHDNSITNKPICSVRNCRFEKCKAMNPNTTVKKHLDKADKEGYCLIRNEKSRASALITTAETERLTLFGTSFSDCQCLCLVANDAWGPAFVEKCEFTRCSYTMPVQLSHIKAKISSCVFTSCSGGLYYHAQCYEMEMKDCRFDKCKGSSSWLNPEMGILNIFTENEELKSYITNCTFSSCRAEESIVHIGAFEPSSKQRGNIIMKKCSFKGCEAEKEIRGEEMGRGFFAGRVKLYEIDY